MKKPKKLKASAKVDSTGKLQLQYRDWPEAIECVKQLGEESGLGPSGVIGALLRAHVKIPGEIERGETHEAELAFLLGIIRGRGIAKENGAKTWFRKPKARK